MMTLRRLTLATVLVSLSLVLGLPALAHADNNESPEAFVTFFHSSNAEANWVHFTPAPAGDPDTWSIRLLLHPIPPNSYAGATLHNVAGPPPATPPSFDYYSTVAGGSLGSPRLVMVFSDGGDMELRPLVWIANVWAHEDGSTTDWDVNGGTCGFLYAATYSAGLACHAGKTVTDVFVVTDSAYTGSPYPSGYTHFIDNIHYGSAFITSPQGGCHESDGNGDFQGDHGKGNFNHDGDGCMDGDQDQVSSTNRGDGRDFQSTQITTATFDAVANTVTITGIGTSNGIPLSFIFVALETGPTTPGWVSFAFSDGYTNAGTLISGSILLH